MSQYIQRITDSLTGLISELAENPSLFLRNPKTDFSRNRKIDFKTFVGITMNAGAGTMNKELLDYFNFDLCTPTPSAYTQQRSKVLPEAFEYLFHTFTKENMPSLNSYNGYRVVACDGSNISFSGYASDQSTARRSNQNQKVSNHLHMNAFYDVLNRIYLDTYIQSTYESQEITACISMMERSDLDKVILVVDRGYENYNLMAHAIKKGWKFVMRVKDRGSSGMAAKLPLPECDSFDTDIKLTFTRQQTKRVRNAGLKYIPSYQTLDYLPPYSKGTFDLSFRVVRLRIDQGSYEILITNLDRSSFPASCLKEIYHLRWGIETSFRELKHAIGLTSFHARKTDYIKQEIYARLLLYNYCELITTHVIGKMKNKDKTKQVNFTAAICVCREFLRKRRQLSPPDVIKLIERNILPVRPGRRDPRKVKPQASVSFLYRVA